MGTVYAFFADGFEEIEALTTIDTLRRAGLDVEIVSVTPDEIVTSLMLSCCFYPEVCRELPLWTNMKGCVN